METKKFVHLRAHSSYSLSEGAIKVKDIVGLAKNCGMPAVALTDNGNLFGSLEFSSAAIKSGIKPIIGGNFNITENGKEIGQLLFLAKNEEGYRNLLWLASQAFSEAETVSTPRFDIAHLETKGSGLIALSGGLKGEIGKALVAKNLPAAEKALKRMKKLFSRNFYIELQRHNIPTQQRIEKDFIELAYKYEIPLVATNDVYFADKELHAAADVLLCIADGSYVSQDDRRSFSEQQYFKCAEEMELLFKDIPEAIDNTLEIAKRCSVMAEERAPILPSFPTAGGRTEEEELEVQARAGLKSRLEKQVLVGKPQAEWEKISKPYYDRLEFEVAVISRMKFPGYFLIVSDFIKWSKANGIPVGPGRGSGAGSVVAWALEITDLDPLRFGLLFERFLNPDRVSMPDFDIDFCQERRDEVIEYVRKKYGNERVAQIITFGKLQARAVLRDVGRTLQMPYTQVDKICKMIPFNPINPVTLAQAIDLDPVLQKERDENPEVSRLLDIGLKLEGMHRHASTHAAGIVIGDRPLIELVPLYSDPRSSIPAIQYSMKYAEAAGLIKFDFLGLKTLTLVSNACKLIKENGGVENVASTSYDDKKAYELLAKGDTTGVFQIESSGMKDALRKMRPDKIEDIIALISLYRPGPMDNIPTYIARKHGHEKPDYIHQMLEETLKETFGVIIYQEQVMKIAQVLAGYTLGAADLLRRAMGKKNLEEMAAQRKNFCDGAEKNGVEKSKATQIFDLVDKFAGYGFNKSHAAAYAIISYQTAYLKANFMVEFLVASMNLELNDTDKLNIFRQEAINHNIKILPPDINKSDALFRVEYLANGEKAIRYALGALKGVGVHAMRELLEEREMHGFFRDIFDFAKRCSSKVINKRHLEGLAKAGAFDSLDNNRKKLFDSAGLLAKFNNKSKEETLTNQTSLFSGEVSVAENPALAQTSDWQSDERNVNEFEAIGFYLTSHPLDNLVAELGKLNVYMAATLEDKIVQTPQAKPGRFQRGVKIKVAGVVTSITHRASGKKRFTYVQVSDPSGVMEVSFFDEKLISDSRELLESKKPLLFTVEARKDEGGVRLVAENVTLLARNTTMPEPATTLQVKLLQLHLENIRAVNEIKKILPPNEVGKVNGPGKVSLTLNTSTNLNVGIDLPGQYAIDENVLLQLKTLEGVKIIQQI